MYEWQRLIQIVVDEIDERILRPCHGDLALEALAKKLGYSEFHTSRRFREMSGMALRDYIRLRKLAFALDDVRDTATGFLEIAVKYGFGSQEAFTRAFKKAYGITPGSFRKYPRPVVLRTKINTFDRYMLGKGEIGMITSNEDIKIYFATIPAHKFLHIKNYESKGYWDFWAKQDKIPGQDCDTICALLDSVKGKLDGKDGTAGLFSGQIMAQLHEAGGKTAEAYGVRIPAAYKGPIPRECSSSRYPKKNTSCSSTAPSIMKKKAAASTNNYRQPLLHSIFPPQRTSATQAKAASGISTLYRKVLKKEFSR